MATKAAPLGKVLVVDDDARFLSTVEALLALDFDTTTCPSPKAALDLDLSQFHVVCADFGMPEMNGLELLGRVAERSQYTCCLLITGADDFFDSVKPAAQRPPVVLKPLDPERFVGTVTHLVRISEMKRATRAMFGVGAGVGTATTPSSSHPPPAPGSDRGNGRPKSR